MTLRSNLPLSYDLGTLSSHVLYPTPQFFSTPLFHVAVYPLVGLPVVFRYHLNPLLLLHHPSFPFPTLVSLFPSTQYPFQSKWHLLLPLNLVLNLLLIPLTVLVRLPGRREALTLLRKRPLLHPPPPRRLVLLSLAKVRNPPQSHRVLRRR